MITLLVSNYKYKYYKRSSFQKVEVFLSDSYPTHYIYVFKNDLPLLLWIFFEKAKYLLICARHKPCYGEQCLFPRPIFLFEMELDK